MVRGSEVGRPENIYCYGVLNKTLTDCLTDQILLPAALAGLWLVSVLPWVMVSPRTMRTVAEHAVTGTDPPKTERGPTPLKLNVSFYSV